MSGNKNSGKKKYLIPSVKIGLSIRGDIHRDLELIAERNGVNVAKTVYKILSEKIEQFEGKEIMYGPYKHMWE